MSDLYDDEAEYVKAINDLFSKMAHLHFNTHKKIAGSNYVMDVNIFLNDTQLSCYMIVEFKNKTVPSASKPYTSYHILFGGNKDICTLYVCQDLPYHIFF